MSVLVVCMVLMTMDAQRRPADQAATRVLIGAIQAWRVLGPVLGDHTRCLYTPTCSVYGELAIRRFGAYQGGWLAIKRIFRCSPWADTWGEDWP